MRLAGWLDSPTRSRSTTTVWKSTDPPSIDARSADELAGMKCRRNKGTPNPPTSDIRQNCPGSPCIFPATIRSKSQLLRQHGNVVPAVRSRDGALKETLNPVVLICPRTKTARPGQGPLPGRPPTPLQCFSAINEGGHPLKISSPVATNHHHHHHHHQPLTTAMGTRSDQDAAK